MSGIVFQGVLRMATQLQEIENNGTVKFATLDNKVGANHNGIYTLLCYGTFDSATVKIQISPDGGTTKIQMKDTDGSSDLQFTADGLRDIRLQPNSTTALELYAVTSGGTSPDITVALVDQN